MLNTSSKPKKAPFFNVSELWYDGHYRNVLNSSMLDRIKNYHDFSTKSNPKTLFRKSQFKESNNLKSKGNESNQLDFYKNQAHNRRDKISLSNTSKSDVDIFEGDETDLSKSLASKSELCQKMGIKKVREMKFREKMFSYAINAFKESYKTEPKRIHKLDGLSNIASLKSKDPTFPNFASKKYQKMFGSQIKEQANRRNSTSGFAEMNSKHSRKFRIGSGRKSIQRSEKASMNKTYDFKNNKIVLQNLEEGYVEKNPFVITNLKDSFDKKENNFFNKKDRINKIIPKDSYLKNELDLNKTVSSFQKILPHTEKSRVQEHCINKIYDKYGVVMKKDIEKDSEKLRFLGITNKIHEYLQEIDKIQLQEKMDQTAVKREFLLADYDIRQGKKKKKDDLVNFYNRRKNNLKKTQEIKSIGR